MKTLSWLIGSVGCSFLILTLSISLYVSLLYLYYCVFVFFHQTKQTYFNLLYTVYSIPNIFLPFLGGYFVDKFGVRTCLVAFVAMITLGASVSQWIIHVLLLDHMTVNWKYSLECITLTIYKHILPSHSFDYITSSSLCCFFILIRLLRLASVLSHGEWCSWDEFSSVLVAKVLPWLILLFWLIGLKAKR